MKVDIVSRENIRPSCLTPHPRHHTLSAADQWTVPAYVPFVFFYSPPPHRIDDHDINRILKDSLSQVLDRFYPLAGRIHDDSCSVHCNDQGVEYAVARVDCDLSSALETPSLEMLRPLVQDKAFAATCNDPFVLVQSNTFLCGGMALAVKVSHQLADTASIATFVKGWSNAALGYPDSAVPDFTTFSNRSPPVKGARYSNPPMSEEDLTLEGPARRFVFEGSKISKLKQHMANDEVKDPTRVEAVSCFLWKRIVNVTKKAAAPPGGGRRTTALLGGVDVRASLVPPVPGYTFGNAVAALCAVGDESDLESTGGIRQFRESVVEARREAAAGGGGGGKNAAAASKVLNKTDVGMKPYMFRSQRRMPLYEADFGWGKPTWVSFGHFNGTSSINLFEASDGCGIEVWVKLVEEELVLLEQDQELMEFATLNPPVIVNNNRSR